MTANLNEVSLGTFYADEKTIDIVTRVLKSGRLSYGPVSQEFEWRFSSLHHSKHGVLSNSGTSSLQVAIQALGEQKRWKPYFDGIVVPSITFVATVNAVMNCGFQPHFVDVDPDYYDLDPKKLEQFFESRKDLRGMGDIVAVIAVNAFGQPASLAEITEICRRYNATLIEDSCESMFVNHYGKAVGSWGAVGVFSMYMAHILTAGVGGIAITDDEELANLMRSLVNHGISMEGLPGGHHFDSTWLARKFEFVRSGHSFRITEIEAAIALKQMEKWTTIIDGRQRSADHYLRSLADLDPEYIKLPKVRASSEHSWMVFPILVCQEEKHGLMKHLAENKVETRDMLPLTNQPYLKDIIHGQRMPVAEMINHHGFYIGCHQDLSAYQIERACSHIYDYFKGQSYYGNKHNRND